MPYSGISDPSLPEHVRELPADKRRQWMTVFEQVLADTGDEGQAMAAANSAVKGLDALVAFGGAVKALKDGPTGRIGGYLVLWGDASKRDLQGEYFTPDTDLALDWYPRRPVLYHHGLDLKLGPLLCGQFDLFKADDVGLWVEGQLDMRKRYVEAVYGLVEDEALGFSSGSLPHLVRVDRDGHIRRWPIVEGSLTPTPAEPRILVLPVKALLDLPTFEGLTTKGRKTDESALTVHGPGPSTGESSGGSPNGADSPHNTNGDEPDVTYPPNPGGESAALPPEDPEGPPPEPAEEDEDTPMTPEQVTVIIDATLQALGVTDITDEQKQQLIQAVLGQVQPNAESGTMSVTPENAQAVGQQVGQAAIQVVKTFLAQRDAHKAATAQVRALEHSLTPVSGAPTGVAAPPPASLVEVRSKFAALSGSDMAFLWTVLRERKEGWTPTDAFLRELADKVHQEVQAGKHVYLHLDESSESPAMKAIQTIRATGSLALKDNEVMGTDQVGHGQEWVPDLWSNELWRMIRIDSPVLSQIRVTDMPSNPYILPIQGADPIVYRVPETTDDVQFNPATSPVPASQAGTGKKTLTAFKLGARIPVSAELEITSIIPMIPELKEQMLDAMLDAIEYVVLHADTTIAGSPSGNINKYDAATLVTDKDRWLLGFDGIAKLPLVTDTTRSINHAGAAPTLTLMRSLRARLKPQYIAKRDQLFYLTDPVTGLKLEDIDEVKTLDKYGPQATVLTGELGKVDNITILQTDQWNLADDNGKLSVTPANNVWGRIMLLFAPAIRLGYLRRVTSELVRFPLADAQQLVSFVNVALVRLDGECVTLGYNIKV